MKNELERKMRLTSNGANFLWSRCYLSFKKAFAQAPDNVPSSLSPLELRYEAADFHKRRIIANKSSSAGFMTEEG